MPRPLLSVFMPNYNHGRFLRRSLGRILGQSFGDIELVVIDDGSTDDSVAIIEDFARQDARVRFLRNEHNRGVIYTLNRALAETRADWVFGASADDLSLPGFFADAMRLTRAHPEAAICCGRVGMVGDSGEVFGESPESWAGRPGYLSPAEVASRIRRSGVPGTAICRRDALLAAGAYDGSLRWLADWFPYQVLALRHGVCFLPRRVALSHWTPASFSAAQRDPEASRGVLREVLLRLRSEAFADVRPMFLRSNVLGQFGPDAARVVAADEDLHDPGTLELVAGGLLSFGRSLLQDTDPEVRRGTAELLGRLGGRASGLLPMLDRTLECAWEETATAAARSRAVILADASALAACRYHARRLAGTVLRPLVRLARPLAGSLYRRLNSRLYDRIGHLEEEVWRLRSTVSRLKGASFHTGQPRGASLESGCVGERRKPPEDSEYQGALRPPLANFG
jgi:hypothetical protein